MHSRGTDHGSQADVSRIGKHPQSVPHEYAVLSPQRCYVRNCSQRDEIEHPPDERVVLPEVFGEGEGELEGYAYRGEILVGILAAVLPGVEHSQTFRERLTRQVVVGDDDIYAGATQLCDRRGMNGTAFAPNSRSVRVMIVVEQIPSTS